MKKRVKIPSKKPFLLLTLAKKVQAKHAADGEASALKILNWQVINPALDKAFDDHERAERLRREMLEAYQQRDLGLDAVTNLVRDSRDILTGAYKKEMKKLGQWGFEVLEVRGTLPEVEPEVTEAAS